jgi:hypothetical protein
MHPNREIIFVGREFEYLYELTQLLAPEPERFKLMNVPAKNEGAGYVAYVKSFGLDSPAVTAGKSFLLVDSGDGALARSVWTRTPVEVQKITESIAMQPETPAMGSLRVILTGFPGYSTDSAPDIHVDLQNSLLNLPSSRPDIESVEIKNDKLSVKLKAASAKETAKEMGEAAAYRADLKAFAKKGAKDFQSSLAMWEAVAKLQNKKMLPASEEIRSTMAASLQASGKTATSKESSAVISAGTRDAKRAQLRSMPALTAAAPLKSEWWYDEYKSHKEYYYDSLTPKSSSTKTPTEEKTVEKDAPTKVSPIATDPVGEAPKTKINPLPPLSPTSTEKNPYAPKSFAGLNLKPGEWIKTPAGEVYRVEKYLDEGKRGRVYLVTQNGKQYIIKIAKFGDAETLDSFAREKVKIQMLEKYKLPHARLIEHGKDVMIKDFVNGPRLKEVLEDWEKNGMKKNDKRVDALRALLDY